jgi:hypothetical protein
MLSQELMAVRQDRDAAGRAEFESLRSLQVALGGGAGDACGSAARRRNAEQLAACGMGRAAPASRAPCAPPASQRAAVEAAAMRPSSRPCSRQAELAAEAVATLELLNKAESLVLAAAGAEGRRGLVLAPEACGARVASGRPGRPSPCLPVARVRGRPMAVRRAWGCAGMWGCGDVGMCGLCSAGGVGGAHEAWVRRAWHAESTGASSFACVPSQTRVRPVPT